MERSGHVERCRPRSRWWLTTLLGVGLVAACTTNHDSLARKPPPASSGAGGGGSGGGAGSGFGNSGNQPQGGRYNPDDERPGDNVLTIVNGIVDAGAVRLCFGRVGSGGVELVGGPLPTLGYGSSTILTELDGLSFADDAIEAWAIAGDLSLLEQLDCQEAVELAEAVEASATPTSALEAAGGAGGATDGAGGATDGAGGATDGAGGATDGAGGAMDGRGGAGGTGSEASAGAGGEGGDGPTTPLEEPPLRARSVAALPAGTFAIGRSMLMVLTGCMGGAAYADRVASSACGAGYMPDSPTLQPIVVKLSRELEFDKVGLQGVHGSLATESLDLRVSGDSATSFVFASSVAFGGIEPRPADTRFTPLELGVDRRDYGLQAIDESGNVAFQEGWPTILERAGIPAMKSARTYTAVFLGPDPRLLKTSFWNDNAFTLVDNDPTRE